MVRCNIWYSIYPGTVEKRIRMSDYGIGDGATSTTIVDTVSSTLQIRTIMLLAASFGNLGSIY